MKLPIFLSTKFESQYLSKVDISFFEFLVFFIYEDHQTYVLICDYLLKFFFFQINFYRIIDK